MTIETRITFMTSVPISNNVFYIIKWECRWWVIYIFKSIENSTHLSCWL